PAAAIGQSVIPSEERLGKPRHGRERRRLSEGDVSESNPATLLHGSVYKVLRLLPRLRDPLRMTMAELRQDSQQKIPLGPVENTFVARCTASDDEPARRAVAQRMLLLIRRKTRRDQSLHMY